MSEQQPTKSKQNIIRFPSSESATEPLSRCSTLSAQGASTLPSPYLAPTHPTTLPSTSATRMNDEAKTHWQQYILDPGMATSAP